MSRWEGRMARLRERMARRVPYVLTNYPFEVLASFVALVIGIPLLVGLVSPTSLAVLLPPLGYWAYAIAITTGGATVGYGLRKRDPMVLSSGLQLLGGTFFVYGLAVVAFGGWATAWAACVAFTVIGLLALVRSLHFRRLLDITRGARTTRRRT